VPSQPPARFGRKKKTGAGSQKPAPRAITDAAEETGIVDTDIKTLRSTFGGVKG